MKRIFLVLLISCYSSFVFAKDYGVFGKTYPIQEKNLLELIQERINQKAANGELDKLNEEIKQRYERYIKKPIGIKLPRATNYNSRSFDVTYTLPNDIFDADGKLLFKAGITVNPLSIKPMKKILCFLDGDDELQVEWGIKYCSGNDTKFILVNGEWQQLAEKSSFKVYFDQGSRLVNKFNIVALPTIVRGNNEVLFVEEIPLITD